MVVPGNSTLPIMSNFPSGRNLGSSYNIYSHPLRRDNIADIFLSYYVDVQGQDDAGNFSGDPIHHTECQPYIITWCGDGVTDSTV